MFYGYVSFSEGCMAHNTVCMTRSYPVYILNSIIELKPVVFVPFMDYHVQRVTNQGE